MLLPFLPKASRRKSFLKKEELRVKIRNLGAFMIFLKTFIDLSPNPIQCFVYSRHSVNNYVINQNERPECGPHVQRDGSPRRDHCLSCELDLGQNGGCFLQIPLRVCLTVTDVHSNINQHLHLSPAMCWVLEKVAVLTCLSMLSNFQTWQHLYTMP